MKILIVCQYYYPEQFRVNDISRSFVEAGHDVTVLTGLPNYPSGKIPKEYRFFRRRREVIQGVKVIRVPLIARVISSLRLGANYISFMLSSWIYSLFCGKDYDAVYVHQTSPVTMAVPALAVGRRAGAGVMLYCLDIWPECLAAKGIPPRSPLYRMMLWFSRFIYRRVDLLAVSTLSFKKNLKENFDLDPSRVEYIPQYAEDLFSRERCPEIPHEGVNFVFAGNVGEMQSVETIVRAAAATKDLKCLTWHIVGDGSAKTRCEALAESLGLGGTVRFHGSHPLEEMPRFYGMADAMLVTMAAGGGAGDTLPGKMQTYLAAGKPVLGAAGGETREVILRSGCGLCCGPGDYEGLSRLAREFIGEPAKWKVYARNSMKFYRDNFEKSAFIHKTLELLKNMKRK